MIRLFLSFCALCLLGLGLVGGGLAYSFSLYKTKGFSTQKIQITIPKGTGVGGIATLLERVDIIEYPLLFKMMARITNVQGELKAGEYEFSAQISMEDVFDKLSKGDVITRQVTIPEGYTSYEIVRLFKTKGDLTQDTKMIPKEGSLLPDTYAYQKTDSVQTLVHHMQKNMLSLLEEAWTKREINLPFKTKKEALILASIVEKETGVASERARIAGVFINRLQKGMPLQTDPTVIYALTKGAHKNNGNGPLGRRLLRKDLSIDSPYNTYKYAGLPPTPICNPGKDAILATLNPEKHDYIYFVADGTGGHVFAKTLAEHNKNVAQWRKIRRNKK